MKKFLLIIIGTLLISSGAIGFQPVFADDTTSLSEATFNVKSTLQLDGQGSYFEEGEDFEKDRSPFIKLIVYVIEFVTKVIGSIAMILVIIGGFMLMVSQGNQQTLDKGKEVIKYAFFGLMIMFASYTIGVFIQSIFYD